MSDLINLLLLLGMDAGILPTTTPQDIFNYITKENSNARYECTVPTRGDAAEYLGTKRSTNQCESRDADAPAQDSH